MREARTYRDGGRSSPTRLCTAHKPRRAERDGAPTHSPAAVLIATSVQIERRNHSASDTTTPGFPARGGRAVDWPDRPTSMSRSRY